MNTESVINTLTIGAFTVLGLRAPAAAAIDASAVHALPRAAAAGIVSGSDGGAGNG